MLVDVELIREMAKGAPSSLRRRPAQYRTDRRRRTGKSHLAMIRKPECHASSALILAALLMVRAQPLQGPRLVLNRGPYPPS